MSTYRYDYRENNSVAFSEEIGGTNMYRKLGNPVTPGSNPTYLSRTFRGLERSLGKHMLNSNLAEVRRINKKTGEILSFSIDGGLTRYSVNKKHTVNQLKKETSKCSGNCSDKTLMDEKNEVKSLCESMCHVLAGYFGFKMPHIFVGLDSITNPDEYKWWAYIHIAKRKVRNLKKYSGEAEDIFNRTNTDNYTTGEFGKVWKEDGGRSGFITIAFGCYSEDSAKLLEQAFITDFDLRNPEKGFNKR